MISVDGSLFIQIANFLILIWALNILVYKPIRKILLQRREKVSGTQESIAAYQQEAMDQDQAYLKGVRSARVEGLKKKEAFIDEAGAEEKKILAKINEKAQSDLAAIRAKVASDAETVRAALSKEIDSFAEAISQKILGRTV